MNDPDNQNKSGIEKIPEATRKKILIFLVSFITLAIFIGWASNFSNTIDLSKDDESAEEFDEILEHTAEAVNQIKAGVDQIKQLRESLPTTSPELTPELTNEEVEKLKDKIEEIQDQKQE